MKHWSLRINRLKFRTSRIHGIYIELIKKNREIIPSCNRSDVGELIN
jgi:hypothetical protein